LRFSNGIRTDQFIIAIQVEKPAFPPSPGIASGQLRDLRCDEEPRPRIYFEEWDEPLITGIGWVSEAIKLVGGDESAFFRSGAKASRDRQVEGAAVWSADPQIIPQIIFASWCGKPVDLRQITTRPGWDVISAVRSGEIHEIDSADILQPGPRVLEGIKPDVRNYRPVAPEIFGSEDRLRLYLGAEFGGLREACQC
jgi:hypothetical protein